MSGITQHGLISLNDGQYCFIRLDSLWTAHAMGLENLFTQNWDSTDSSEKEFITFNWVILYGFPEKRDSCWRK